MNLRRAGVSAAGVVCAGVLLSPALPAAAAAPTSHTIGAPQARVNPAYPSESANSGKWGLAGLTGLFGLFGYRAYTARRRPDENQPDGPAERPSGASRQKGSRR